MRLDKNLKAVVIHLCILESLQHSGNKCKKIWKIKSLKIFDFSKTNVLQKIHFLKKIYNVLFPIFELCLCLICFKPFSYVKKGLSYFPYMYLGLGLSKKKYIFVENLFSNRCCFWRIKELIWHQEVNLLKMLFEKSLNVCCCVVVI